MPFPMKSTANLLGKTSAGVIACSDSSDSSQGKAITTPAPRRSVRRDIGWEGCGIFFMATLPFLCQYVHPPVQKLRAGHDVEYQRVESKALGVRLRGHPVHRQVVGHQE